LGVETNSAARMADPTAIAKSFLSAFASFAQAGNAAGLASLYGADSFAAYEGTAKRGQADIAAAFIAPRLPAAIRFATVLVQPTPVNTLLVVTNGDSDKPAGRFTQVFVLAPTAGGSFYVKADICRCVGARPRRTIVPPAPPRPPPPPAPTTRARSRCHPSPQIAHSSPPPLPLLSALGVSLTAAPSPRPLPARSYSAGAAPQQTVAETAPGMGASFVSQYFGAASSNRAALAPFYHPAKSQLTVDQGAPVVGQAAIMAKMLGAAGGAPPLDKEGTPAPGMPKLTYSAATLDSQSVLEAPVNGVTGATLVVTTGQVMLEGETNPLNFGQAFLLLQEGGATYLANDIYSLNCECRRARARARRTRCAQNNPNAHPPTPRKTRFQQMREEAS
jgi:hypothetical protein